MKEELVMPENVVQLTPEQIKQILATLNGKQLYVHEADHLADAERFFVATVPQESLDPAISYAHLGIWNDKGLCTKDVAEMIAAIPSMLAALVTQLKSLDKWSKERMQDKENRHERWLAHIDFQTEILRRLISLGEPELEVPELKPRKT